MLHFRVAKYTSDRNDIIRVIRDGDNRATWNKKILIKALGSKFVECLNEFAEAHRNIAYKYIPNWYENNEILNLNSNDFIEFEKNGESIKCIPSIIYTESRIEKKMSNLSAIKILPDWMYELFDENGGEFVSDIKVISDAYETEETHILFFTKENEIIQDKSAYDSFRDEYLNHGEKTCIQEDLCVKSVVKYILDSGREIKWNTILNMNNKSINEKNKLWIHLALHRCVDFDENGNLKLKVNIIHLNRNDYSEALDENDNLKLKVNIIHLNENNYGETVEEINNIVKNNKNNENIVYIKKVKFLNEYEYIETYEKVGIRTKIFIKQKKDTVINFLLQQCKKDVIGEIFKKEHGEDEFECDYMEEIPFMNGKGEWVIAKKNFGPPIFLWNCNYSNLSDHYKKYIFHEDNSECLKQIDIINKWENLNKESMDKLQNNELLIELVKENEINNIKKELKNYIEDNNDNNLEQYRKKVLLALECRNKCSDFECKIKFNPYMFENKSIAEDYNEKFEENKFYIEISDANNIKPLEFDDRLDECLSDDDKKRKSKKFDLILEDCLNGMKIKEETDKNTKPIIYVCNQNHNEKNNEVRKFSYIVSKSDNIYIYILSDKGQLQHLLSNEFEVNYTKVEMIETVSTAYYRHGIPGNYIHLNIMARNDINFKDKLIKNSSYNNVKQEYRRLLTADYPLNTGRNIALLAGYGERCPLCNAKSIIGISGLKVIWRKVSVDDGKRIPFLVCKNCAEAFKKNEKLEFFKVLDNNNKKTYEKFKDMSDFEIYIISADSKLALKFYLRTKSGEIRNEILEFKPSIIHRKLMWEYCE